MREASERSSCAEVYSVANNAYNGRDGREECKKVSQPGTLREGERV